MPELAPDPWFIARSALLCLLVLAPFAGYALLVRRRLELLRTKPLLLEPVAYIFIATAAVVVAKTGAVIALGPRLYQMPFLHESIVGSQTTRILTSGYLANLAFVAPVVLALALLARGRARRSAPPMSPPGRLRQLANRGLRAPGLPTILTLALGIAVAVLLYFVLFDLEIGSLRELSGKRFLGEQKEANPARFYSLRYALFKFAGLPKIVCIVALAAYLFVSRSRALLTLALLAIASFYVYGVVFSVRAHILLFALEASVLLALARPRRWRLAVAGLMASALLVSAAMTVTRMRPNRSDFFATTLRQPPADETGQQQGMAGGEAGSEQPAPTAEGEAAAGPTVSAPGPETPRGGPSRRRPAARAGAPKAAMVTTIAYNVAVRVSSLRYFSDISKLAVIIDRWEDEHSFLYGETFYSWVTLPLGDTPLITFAELGRHLGEHTFRHARSGVTPGLIGELYVNFSWPGIIVGGLLIGVLAWRFEIWTDRGLTSPLAATLLSLSIVKLFLLLLNGTLGSTVLNLSLEFSLVALLALLAAWAGSGGTAGAAAAATSGR